MRDDLLDYLVCPISGSALELEVTRRVGEEIVDGVLTSAAGTSYPIRGGIPRFVEDEEYAGTFGYQWKKFARLQLDSQNGTHFSRDRFFSITEWSPDDLRGKVVLDAGCGAGRFAEVALAAGATVIAMDLSRAVEACAENLAHERLHCLQGSIYDMPFKEGSFDFVYCLGVIQHTPDPERAVRSLLKKVAPGGHAGLWIYELDWRSFVGTVAFKYAARPLTKRSSIETVERLSRLLEHVCWPIVRIARKAGRPGRMIMRLLPVSSSHLAGIPLSDEDFREWVRLDTFDMYSPAHDHPQRFSSVASWLRSEGFEVERRHPHGAISITGQRSMQSTSR